MVSFRSREELDSLVLDQGLVWNSRSLVAQLFLTGDLLNLTCLDHKETQGTKGLMVPLDSFKAALISSLRKDTSAQSSIWRNVSG